MKGRWLRSTIGSARFIMRMSIVMFVCLTSGSHLRAQSRSVLATEIIATWRETEIKEAIASFECEVLRQPNDEPQDKDPFGAGAGAESELPPRTEYNGRFLICPRGMRLKQEINEFSIIDEMAYSLTRPVGEEFEKMMAGMSSYSTLPAQQFDAQSFSDVNLFLSWVNPLDSYIGKDLQQTAEIELLVTTDRNYGDVASMHVTNPERGFKILFAKDYDWRVVYNENLGLRGERISESRFEYRREPSGALALASAKISSTFMGHTAEFKVNEVSFACTVEDLKLPIPPHTVVRDGSEAYIVRRDGSKRPYDSDEFKSASWQEIIDTEPGELLQKSESRLHRGWIVGGLVLCAVGLFLAFRRQWGQ